MSFEKVSAAPFVNIAALQTSREYRIYGHIKDEIILKLFVMIYLGNQILWLISIKIAR